MHFTSATHSEEEACMAEYFHKNRHEINKNMKEKKRNERRNGKKNEGRGYTQSTMTMLT